MVSVCLEVSDGTANFTVAVRARSIERAVRIVAERYPVCPVRVEFPIDTETFFAGNTATEGLISTERRAA